MPATAAEVAGLLADWLPHQRWFGGKGRPVEGVSVVSSEPLVDGEPTLGHLIVRVEQGEDSARYQVPYGARRELPQRLEHALIGRAGDSAVYDAPHDAELTRPLLELLAGDREAGPVRFHRVPGVDLRTDLASIVVGTEQSNTSLVYGEEYILKVFRKVSPGLNPDLEITRALAEADCPYIVPPLAWMESGLD